MCSTMGKRCAAPWVRVDQDALRSRTTPINMRASTDRENNKPVLTSSAEQLLVCISWLDRIVSNSLTIVFIMARVTSRSCPNDFKIRRYSTHRDEGGSDSSP